MSGPPRHLRSWYRMVPFHFLLFFLCGIIPRSSLTMGSSGNEGQHVRGALTSSNNSTFFWFSDLHYDPFYGTSDAYPRGACQQNNSNRLGRYGCDSPLSLIISALSASQIRIVKDKLDFIVVSGDFVRHGTNYFDDPLGGIKSALVKMTQLFRAEYGGSTGRNLVVPVIGNNDMAPDYYLDLTAQNNTALINAADAFGQYFLTPAEIETMKKGGFFARNVTDIITILSINTIPYSSFHLPQNQSYIKDPFGQFEWMESHLRHCRATNRRVYIVGHIAPTIGSFRKTQLWQDRYLTTYFGLMEAHVDVVAAQLFGHIHSDEFRVFPSQRDNGAPFLLCPSLTPIFGSNPGFRVVTFKRDDGNILDFDSYYMNLNASDIFAPKEKWEFLYSFREAYGVPDLSVPSLREVVRRIGPSSSKNEEEKHTRLIDKFLGYQRVSTEQGDCDETCQFEWTCVLTAATKSDYLECLHPEPSSFAAAPELYILLAAVGVAIILAAVMLGTRLFRYRKIDSQYDLPAVTEDRDVI